MQCQKVLQFFQKETLKNLEMLPLKPFCEVLLWIFYIIADLN